MNFCKQLILVSALVLLFMHCRDKENGRGNGLNNTGVKTLRGNYTWGNLTMGGGGFVTGIVTSSVERNLIFIRTDVGGAYRWIESSQSWKPITDFIGPDETSLLGVQSIAIDPGSPNRVYIAAGTSYWNNGYSCILISDNYGDSFTKIDVTSMFKFHGNAMGRQNGERLAVDPNKGSVLFCGSRLNGLWKSTDSGQTWTQIISFPVTSTPNDNGICAVLFDKSSGTEGSATPIIYTAVSCSGSANLFISKDAGESWKGVTDAITAYMPQQLLLNNGYLYVSYADAEGPWNSTKGCLRKFNTTSQTWTDISPDGTTPMSGISVNVSNTMLVATSINKWVNQGNNIYGEEIYISTDDGSSWIKQFQSGSSKISEGDCGWMKSLSLHWVGDIEVDPFNADRAFAISGNGVFMTTNLTSNAPVWVFTSKGIEETVPYDIISIPDGPVISVIADYDGFVHNDISAFPSKRHYPNIGSSSGLAYSALHPNLVVRVGGNSDGRAMYFSQDTGSTWAQIPTSTIGKYAGKVAISADGSTILWAPGSEVYRTDDRGITWTTCNGITGNLAPVADYVNSTNFYAYLNGSFYVSADKGENFSKIPMDAINGSTIIRAVPNHEGHVLIAGGSAGLYLTKDKGSGMTKIETVLTCQAVGTGKPAAGSSYPAIFIYGKTVENSVLGVYRSDDIGLTWVRINDDNSQFGGPANGNFIQGDNNVFGRVYMSTAGRGIVYGDKN